MKKRILIDGMHCHKCAERVANSLKKAEGIEAEVDLKNKCALVSSENEIADDTLKALVEDAGFDVVNIELL